MPKRKWDDHSSNCSCDNENQTAEILKFPDNVLLLVFAHLDTASLIKASKVCKKWYTLSKDSSLWRKLDIRSIPKALSQKSLWRLSRARFTAALRELHLRGSVGPTRAILDSITIPFLDDLKLRCPNLTDLTLENYDLRHNAMSISVLPSQLSYLSLKDSMLAHGWFESLKNNTFNMDNLKYLDLSNCTAVSNTDLEALSYLTKLHTLLLYNCYRISARGIPTIAANLHCLTHLDVACCPGINDVALHYFGRNLNELKKLNLRFCHHVTDSGIASLVYGAKGLEHLDLFSCHEVTNESLKNISKYSKKLKYLDVRSCKVTTEEVMALCSALPQCNVIYVEAMTVATLACNAGHQCGSSSF
ncbi:F-box/LRR-repeat protein 2-like [Rhopilema esculentum]|uniref:F-box/LRR-repeat protein 2-like n=1 Tax=Rhopilema esculentum TaxID=499914 RepID=UPI0031E3CC08|eukprot:gene4977-21321_t